MGSLANCRRIGFVCRLCSGSFKTVIHLFGRKAAKLKLMEKIKLIPVSVIWDDHLPKTICDSCAEKLDMQYDLYQKIKRAQEIERACRNRQAHNPEKCPMDCILYNTPYARKCPYALLNLEAASSGGNANL